MARLTGNYEDKTPQLIQIVTASSTAFGSASRVTGSDLMYKTSTFGLIGEGKRRY